MTRRFTRRASLLRLLGLAAAAGGGAAWKLQSAEGSGPLAVSSGAVACVLTPELTEGPYYVSGEKLRRNVTDGKKGMPLLLKLSVLNVTSCKRIQNATVEIWHCDARGVYSGAVANKPGTNFLRGAQKTNARGVATFQTIYPGWYPGRPVHIHVKVHDGGAVIHTGQLFFPVAIANAVYETAPYRSHGAHPDTANASDAIFRNGGDKGMVKLHRNGAGYVGGVAMGVHV